MVVSRYPLCWCCSRPQCIGFVWNCTVCALCGSHTRVLDDLEILFTERKIRVNAQRITVHESSAQSPAVLNMVS